MKSIILLSFLAIISFGSVHAQMEEALVRECAKSIGEEATYLKDFVVDLGPAEADGRPPQSKFSMVLSKNTVYKFTVCNSDTKPGKGVIQLFDTNRMLGSSYMEATGKDYQGFEFKCQKTGVYHLFVHFQEGKPGMAVCIISYVETM
ncbi:MAG: hypothetical protein ACOC0C_00390 [Bacteroidota bacterium]